MKARSIGRNGPQTTTTRLSIPFYLPKKRRKTPSRFPFYSDSYPHHCCGFPIFSPLGLLILFRPRSFCHLIISLIYLGPFLLLLASFIMLISAHSIGSSVCLSFSFPFFFFFFCSRVTSSSGMVCRVEWSYFANFIFSPPSPLSITLHHPISYHFHQLATSSACLSVFFFFFFSLSLLVSQDEHSNQMAWRSSIPQPTTPSVNGSLPTPATHPFPSAS